MAYQILKNKFKVRPIRIIYIFYWFLLTYILSALIFWYITLNKQNEQIYHYRMQMIGTNVSQQEHIENEKDRKFIQYIGEGVTFLLFLFAGAILIFRLVRKQLIQSHQQQNFVMAITHELKTPIAIAKLNLETMQMRKLDSVQQKKLIQSTIQEANRLNSLCNNMLLMSQIDAGGYTLANEKVDLATFSNDCVEDFIARFPERKIEVDMNPDSNRDETIITADKLLLQLAINNLLDNAIKYSGKDDVVLVKVFQRNRKIILQVIDEGKGVTPREKGKIFEKFFRGAQMQTKGTGLGLYLTKEIVKQHHGDISTTNNIPRGSIFEIRFKISKN
ncbi:MAG TPA: HAMP domain-containing sensor histidine kinase [Hanamia sp.]|nr:HAMP domain-containing sensor histidine kinase [Hanamia sp.]